MNGDNSALSSHEMNTVGSIQQSDQKPFSVAAIEFMTFHHEVLAAFCKHSIELNIETMVVSPSSGIQKAIRRFAADSFTQLAELACINKTRFSLVISNSSKETASRAMDADALFIGTIPPPSSTRSSRTHKIKLNNSRYCEMVLITKKALQQNKLIYIVIHKPQEDAAKLLRSFTADECKKISAIYLSGDTAEYCQKHFPNHFRSELIMPAIGAHDSSTRDVVSTNTGISMVIAGEISSKRRHYESLACLCSDLQWLRSRNVVIKIIGRIRLESLFEKILRLCAVPASYLFLIKYRCLLPLWKDGRLDLSMTRYSKVSDQTLAKAIKNSACLLDLQRKHYLTDGQTTGALGLAMTHQKPLINLGTIKDLIQDNQQSFDQASLNKLIDKETESLIAKKTCLTAQFRQQLLKELALAKST